MIKIVEKTNKEEFEKEMGKLLLKGYSILSTNCGYIQEPYDCFYYVSILKK